MEFFRLCVAAPTAPFTLLLGMVFLYWIMCVLGAVGLDTFDVGVDADADVDLDLDLDVDADVDIVADADVDVDVDADMDVHHGGGSSWITLLKFFNLGEVPLMIVFSVLVLCLWVMSLILNSQWNPGQKTGMALLLVLPNLVVSALATKIATAPFRLVFKRAKEGIAAPTKIVGRRVIITTGEVTDSFGQAELLLDDRELPPITLNVRTRNGVSLRRGDEALVVDHDDALDIYSVVPFDLGVK